ncbi:MAG: DUF2235 domain-containing protein [Hyphomicrobiaceae bacterium]|nr:DUF2235 domain-containing protein [Hyphomicrobiaceae bacterium]
MKRLMCFFDGTWNKPDGTTVATNVLKLARVALGTAPDGLAQVSRYIEGIGTDVGDSEYVAFISGALGVGLDKRILEGYRFLAERYEPGDEIALFGFSRGAFQARSLSGLIARAGLLRHDALDDLDDAWGYYQRYKASPDPVRGERLQSRSHAGVRIRCLGVWDTVGNLGVPVLGSAGGLVDDYAFVDTELAPIVDIGLHALAIDEPRGPFSPTLWTKRRGAALPAAQRIEQVWFPGSHANVGGGFEDSSLSDISLRWMAARSVSTAGIGFDLEALDAMTAPDPLGELVAPTSDSIYRVSAILPFLRLVGQQKTGIPPWRKAVLGTHRTSWLGDEIETVNEALHPSAIARLGMRARHRRGLDAGARLYSPRTLEAARDALPVEPGA